MSDTVEPVIMWRPDPPTLVIHQHAWVLLAVVWRAPAHTFERASSWA